MPWNDEERNNVINNSIDLCTNIENVRQVAIIIITDDGVMNICHHGKSESNELEMLGAYRLLAADMEANLLRGWQADDRPIKTDDDDEI
jgi:hypothetical protein